MVRLPANGPIQGEAGDPRSATAIFSRDVQSVSAARVWVTDFLARVPAVSGVSPDIVLVVSELVTNAMRHGDGDIVALGSFGADEVRVAITDSGEALPVVLPTTTGQIGGLGLHVVGQVADAWGVAPFPGGKTVWATFRLGHA